MSGFIRRFGFFPGDEVLTQIEGTNIIDVAPPGAIDGVDTGFVALVGEFADMRRAVSVDGSGVVSSNYQPTEIFSAQDMLNKVGGFDPTLGDIGNAGGNGFIAVRNKRFSRLAIIPVNLTSATGMRYWRDLPLCTSQTNPLPVVPPSGGVISAGREFRSTTNGRVLIGGAVSFTALDAIADGTGGSLTNAGADAATQDFTVAGQDFSAIQRPDGVGIKTGDIIVIGNNNAGALEPLPAAGDEGAGTYRVAADASSGTPTVLSLERLDGQDFDFVTAASVPFRIHVSSDADSAPVIVLGQAVAGGYSASGLGGYSVPSRPITDEAGVVADGTWTAGSVVSPLVAPPATTGNTWDPLSGLAGRVIPTGGMNFIAATQAQNPANDPTIDALYTEALQSLISNQAPVSEINLIYSARVSSTIRNQLRQHVADASARSLGRTVQLRPELSVVSLETVLGDANPGAGANRAERVDYCWPGVQTFIPEAVGHRLKTADGLTTTNGILDVGSDGFLTGVLSNLPPEKNPGQSQAPVPATMAPVLGLQRNSPALDLNEYIALRARGIVAPRIDPVVGAIFQSGITTSLISGQKNINRRRMADFIQDSIAARLNIYSKSLLTEDNRDSAVTEVNTFLAELRSIDNPATQRIADFRVDDVSGNTPASLAKGIYVIIIRVRTIPTGDFFVLQTEIGEGVLTQTELAA